MRVLVWHDLTYENWVKSTGATWIVFGIVERAVSPTVDTLFAEVHYFLWEIESPFDKPGCFLHRSSCVCLASKQELCHVSSLMGALYKELPFFQLLGRKWMAFIRRCWRHLLSVQKGHEFCSKEVVHFSSSRLKCLLAVGWDVDWPG